MIAGGDNFGPHDGVRSYLSAALACTDNLPQSTPGARISSSAPHTGQYARQGLVSVEATERELLGEKTVVRSGDGDDENADDVSFVGCVELGRERGIWICVGRLLHQMGACSCSNRSREVTFAKGMALGRR
jgi:hypothetical protein